MATTDELGETGLIEALRRGEDSAFEELVRMAGGRMLAVARRFMRSEADAEDVVQEAFLQAFKNIDRFEGNAKLTTWLHRITVNAALMKLRKKKRTHEVAIEDLLPKYMDDGHRPDIVGAWEETPDDLAELRESRSVVRQAIDRLPENYRNVLILRDIEQLDTAETATAMGLSVNATKTRLHRARQALRELLEPHFGQKDAG